MAGFIPGAPVVKVERRVPEDSGSAGSVTIFEYEAFNLSAFLIAGTYVISFRLTKTPPVGSQCNSTSAPSGWSGHGGPVGTAKIGRGHGT